MRLVLGSRADWGGGSTLVFDVGDSTSVFVLGSLTILRVSVSLFWGRSQFRLRRDSVHGSVRGLPDRQRTRVGGLSIGALP